MDPKPARIRLSVSEGLLEIEGSEEFVAKHIESLKDSITKAAPVTPKVIPVKSTEPVKHAAAPAIKGTASTDDYQNLFSTGSDDTINITKELPGDTIQEKVHAATLLYLFAKSLTGGPAEAPFKDIAKVCTDHGSIDKPNFAANVKRATPKYITVSGGGRGSRMVAKLTVPGMTEARRLADELNAS